QRTGDGAVHFFLVLDLAADVEAQPGRQRIALHQRLDVLAGVARGSPMHVGPQADAPLQVLAADVLRVESALYGGDRAQRYHLRRAVGHRAAGGDVQVGDVLERAAVGARQLRDHLVVLAVGREPVAGVLATDEGAQRGAELRVRDADLGRELGLQPDRE